MDKNLCFVLVGLAVLCCLQEAAFVEGADDDALNSVLRSLLRDYKTEQVKNVEEGKVTAGKRQQNEIEMNGPPKTRELTEKRKLSAVSQQESRDYLTANRRALEQMADDVESDESLSEDTRDQLLRNLEELTARARGDRCSRREFTCRDTADLECATRTDMCDGFTDCSDNSDEDPIECDFFQCARCNRRSPYKLAARKRRRMVCVDPVDYCSRPNRFTLLSCNDEPPPCDGGSDSGGSTSGGSSSGGSSSGGSGSSDPCGDIQPETLAHAVCSASMAVHNEKRSLHRDTPPVAYSTSVAASAQSYAERLAREGRFDHSSGDYGENLYLAGGARDTIEAMAEHVSNAGNSWYHEVVECNYNYSYDGSFNSGCVVGHFTQMVWDDTASIGCGVALGEYSSWGISAFVVCQYSPPGNWIGVYDEHVHPPF